MEKDKSVFHSLRDRSCGLGRRENIRRSIIDSKYLVKRLKCENVFVGHEGCVNTVAWNETGDMLLSGSDDCFLNIYRLTSFKPVHSIPSGHRANIFSAKFLPATGDTKVVSCSGDGILHYNDVNSHSFYGKNSFHCHTGTTYEVNTTPGDPHSFMSSGEDGKVRLFDVRSKTKCSCEGCKENVLIDCEKAVTSFSINPVFPYYVAVGCENSTLRVYDRRYLTTDRDSNKLHGLLHLYKPKALETRDCRVTSLKYSSDGQSLLASFCFDYVYTFDSNPNLSNQDQPTNTMDDEPDGTCPHGTNDPPMKRLRLRGDWSDTGPNARPECEVDSGNSENSFVQRMSGYLTRWIEDSLRSTHRRRGRNPTTARARAEEARERSIHRDENPDSLNAEDGSLDPGNDSRDLQETGAVTENDVTQETTNNNSTDLIRSEVTSPSDSRDGEHVEQSCSSGVACNNGGKICTNVHDDGTSGECSTSLDVEDKTDNSEPCTKPLGHQNDQNFKQKTFATGSKSPGEASTTSIIDRGNEDREGIDGELGDSSDSQLSSETHSISLDNVGLITKNVGSTTNQESSTHNPGIETPVSEHRTRGFVPLGTEDVEYRVQESETVVQSSGTDVQSGSSSRTRDASVGEESEDGDHETRRNAAANTIKNFFRYRHKKASTSTQFGVPLFSEPTQIFRGHRNARTMIKEANFWGDDFVLSGSDCGRIFIWSRDTAELVMLLEGDQHVVNCVQPHPYDPILATSGIDYDVKLWTPTALNVCEMDDASEVIACNEKMLKESQDTLTVPASFIIRVLSSLHRVRFNTLDNEQSSDDSDSDLE